MERAMAHRPTEAERDERVTLAPLTFEEAAKRLLRVPEPSEPEPATAPEDEEAGDG